MKAISILQNKITVVHNSAKVISYDKETFHQLEERVFEPPYQQVGRTISHCKVSKDGKFLAICYEDCNDIFVYNQFSTDFIGCLSGHSMKINAIIFSPKNDGVLVSCSDDTTFIAWSLITMQNLFNSSKQAGCIESFSFSASGTDALTCGWGSEIHFWKYQPPRVNTKNARKR